ncbi:hypothetical protein BDV38DRAFT_280596 [Aspergillus pseudotamarii]|uniref:Extracellular membrane protein CFEM domain-containing protein n=1 Tax=Aspergillus pseudotamarii TaxID=132259 RepID=A0A5N6SZS1_ASPPS|nr:uncharacterized protein BDV38DRAFT_280596 [Aspergillus pseudotamarii]KAE8140132.1 hypothetical protein BDV38DRAFT_280596 [Aspergillus pseudotamarii]
MRFGDVSILAGLVAVAVAESQNGGCPFNVQTAMSCLSAPCPPKCLMEKAQVTDSKGCLDLGKAKALKDQCMEDKYKAVVDCVQPLLHEGMCQCGDFQPIESKCTSLVMNLAA